MFLAAVAFLLLSTPAHAQVQSPCPHVFTVEKLPELDVGRWYGSINLKDHPSWLYLTITLDKKADMLGNWLGEVVTKNNIDFKIDNINVLTKVDRMRFFVKHDPLQPPPKIKSILVNGDEICKNAPADYKTSEIDDTTESTPEEEPHHCGRVPLNPVALVVGGSSTLEGQWPWQVAIYRIEKVNNNFICGGTLVSNQHVITAAHCTTYRKKVVNKNTLTVYLGAHHLITSTLGVQVRFVEKIINYPEYMEFNKRHDLSILLLREPVTFTNWVQPACLWPDLLADLKHVVGERGSVVGWGNDNSGELKLVNMPIVDQLTCIRSKGDFYVRFTSEFTFCAGDRDGNSACNGDSGGGMVLKLQDSWYIRGVVSLSLAKQDEPVCDPTQYIIFTDLAQYLPWVRANTQSLVEDLPSAVIVENSTSI